MVDEDQVPKATQKYRWDSSDHTEGDFRRPPLASASSRSIQGSPFAASIDEPTEAQRRAAYIDSLPEWEDVALAKQPPLKEVLNPPKEMQHKSFTGRPNNRSLGRTPAQSVIWQPDKFAFGEPITRDNRDRANREKRIQSTMPADTTPRRMALSRLVRRESEEPPHWESSRRQSSREFSRALSSGSRTERSTSRATPLESRALSSMSSSALSERNNSIVTLSGESNMENSALSGPISEWGFAPPLASGFESRGIEATDLDSLAGSESIDIAADGVRTQAPSADYAEADAVFLRALIREKDRTIADLQARLRDSSIPTTQVSPRSSMTPFGASSSLSAQYPMSETESRPATHEEPTRSSNATTIKRPSTQDSKHRPQYSAPQTERVKSSGQLIRPIPTPPRPATQGTARPQRKHKEAISEDAPDHDVTEGPETPRPSKENSRKGVKERASRPHTTQSIPGHRQRSQPLRRAVSAKAAAKSTNRGHHGANELALDSGKGQRKRKPSQNWSRDGDDKVLFACCDEDFVADSFEAQITAVAVVGTTVWCSQIDDEDASVAETITIREVDSGKVLQHVEVADPSYRVTAIAPVYGRCPSEVWVGTQLGVICVHSVATSQCYKELRRHSGAVTVMVADPEGECVWSGSDDFSVAVWDKKGRHLWDLHGHKGPINFILPLGPRVWTSAQDGTIRVWTNGTRACVHVLRPPAQKGGGSTQRSITVDAYHTAGSSQPTNSDRYLGSATCGTAVGDTLWWGYDNGMLRLWSAWGSHELVAEIKDVRMGRINSIQLMGEHIWVCGEASTVLVYDVATRACVATHKAHKSYINQMLRVGWIERRVVWTLSRGESKVNIWEKVSTEEGPDGYAERASTLAAVAHSMEEHRNYLAAQLGKLRKECDMTLSGLEANADLYAEEAEEIAWLLFKTQNERYKMECKYNEAIEWKNQALQERDKIRMAMQEMRSEGIKLTLTRFLNRMRFIEVTQSLFEWRDNMHHADMATKESAVVAERIILEILRERAQHAEESRACLEIQLEEEQTKYTELRKHYDDLTITDGGGALLLKVKEASQSVYKSSQLAAQYANQKAKLIGHPQDRELAQNFAAHITKGLTDARFVLHQLEQQVMRGLGMQQERLLRSTSGGSVPLCDDDQEADTPQADDVNGLNDFVEEDIPAAKPPRGSSKYKSPVKLIYIHNSPGNCTVKQMRTDI